ncbi:MAG: PDZ domain-containing protein [Planctomycetota bacterium]|nr:PDZ domain-containing protein [Planctomycetota bacterium]
MKRYLLATVVLFVVATGLIAGIYFSPSEPASTDTPSEHVSPRVSADMRSQEVEMPPAAEQVLENTRTLKTEQVLFTGNFSASGADVGPLFALKSTDDAFVLTTHDGKLEAYRRRKGKTYLLRQHPELSDGSHHLRALLTPGWLTITVDGERMIDPITLNSVDSVWADTESGIEASPMLRPYFSDTFGRWEGEGGWTINAGHFKIITFDFGDKSINPGYMSAICGKPPLTARDEQILIESRVASPSTGIGVVLEASRGGLRIQRISPNSPAAAAGMKENDVILKVNGKRIGIDEFERLERRQGVPMTIEWVRPLQDARPQLEKVTPSTFRWGASLKEYSLKPIQAAPVSYATVSEDNWAAYTFECNMRLLVGQS